MKRYRILYKLSGIDAQKIEEKDTLIECENFIFSIPYEWFTVFRDGLIISRSEYNGKI